jgi:hypothetical protein
MTFVLVAQERNIKGVVVQIDSEKYLDLLDDIHDQAKTNVEEYEGFHQGRLANIRDMDPMDAFLYGIATGKLQQIDYIIDMVEQRKQDLGE